MPPVLYLSHGAPPLVDDKGWVSELAAWCAELPRPTAILVMSAHWEVAPLTVGATDRLTPLTYDFWGFPDRNTSHLRPAGRTESGSTASWTMMPVPQEIPQDPHRGLDHGAYVPLTVMFPTPTSRCCKCRCRPSTRRVLGLGGRLRPLSDDGVLIIGSGFTTHDLSYLTARLRRHTAGVVGRIRCWVAEGC